MEKTNKNLLEIATSLNELGGVSLTTDLLRILALYEKDQIDFQTALSKIKQVIKDEW